MEQTQQQTAKTALVTGGAQRIGAGICQELHAAGFDLWVHYNNSATDAQALADELNALRSDSARTVQCQLDDDAQLAALAAGIKAGGTGLDVLVHNASAFFPATFAETSREDWQRLHKCNAEAPYFLTQALLPELSASKGSVICITDIHAEIPLRNYSAYCASKAALLATVRSMALELAPQIRVNAVAPGAILWPQDGDEEYSQQTKARILERIPLQSLGSVEAIAKAVRYLSLDADYVTGEVLRVDGGRSLAG